MKSINLFLVSFLISCKQEAYVEETMPIEIVQCTHPDSRFEAVVEIEIEDNIMWDDVYFEIFQESNFWDTRLFSEDSIIWTSRMQLYELNCFEEFDYNIIYGDD